MPVALNDRHYGLTNTLVCLADDEVPRMNRLLTNAGFEHFFHPGQHDTMWLLFHRIDDSDKLCALIADTVVEWAKDVTSPSTRLREVRPTRSGAGERVGQRHPDEHSALLAA